MTAPLPAENELLTFFALLGQKQQIELKRIRLEQKLQRSLSREFLNYALQLKDADSPISYTNAPNYKASEDECFYINDFVLPSSIREGLTNLNTLDYVTDDDINSNRVFGLLGARNPEDPDYIFQVFDSRQVLRREKGTIWLRGETFTELDGSGIKIGSKADAVHQNGNLYFRSEHQVRRILVLDAIFQAATDTEVDSFIAHPIWSTSIQRTEHPTLFTDQIRRKITSIGKQDILARSSVAQIRAVAANFGLTLNTETIDGTEKITIPAEKRALRDILSFLDDDFLASTVTGNKYRISSKRRL